MGQACSHVRDLFGHDGGCSHRMPKDDKELLAELRQEIAPLPSYGYRRTRAMVNCQRRIRGAAWVNAKRSYPFLAGAALLLSKAPRCQSARKHERTFMLVSRMATGGLRYPLLRITGSPLGA